ncbi:MAG: DUF4224 domain-containing protein [Burkholderiaceae bacterium]|jgi:hypothetical protein|nr:DUF4224 domain-containing protein [Burkholderiales bacterium]MCZ8339683.1 DUF4224 domain-containing protein [Burkholderiaceae bacterium]
MSLYLTDSEISDICDPLTRPSAQVRYLRSLGLVVNLKPNGRPLVIRSHFEAVLGGLPAKRDDALTEAPNESALILHFKARDGKKAKLQPA